MSEVIAHNLTDSSIIAEKIAPSLARFPETQALMMLNQETGLHEIYLFNENIGGAGVHYIRMVSAYPGDASQASLQPPDAMSFEGAVFPYRNDFETRVNFKPPSFHDEFNRLYLPSEDDSFAINAREAISMGFSCAAMRFTDFRSNYEHIMQSVIFGLESEASRVNPVHAVLYCGDGYSETTDSDYAQFVFHKKIGELDEAEKTQLAARTTFSKLYDSGILSGALFAFGALKYEHPSVFYTQYEKALSEYLDPHIVEDIEAAAFDPKATVQTPGARVASAYALAMYDVAHRTNYHQARATGYEVPR